jgi:hypothetical protein
MHGESQGCPLEAESVIGLNNAKIVSNPSGRAGMVAIKIARQGPLRARRIR